MRGKKEIVAHRRDSGQDLKDDIRIVRRVQIVERRDALRVPLTVERTIHAGCTVEGGDCARRELRAQGANDALEERVLQPHVVWQRVRRLCREVEEDMVRRVKGVGKGVRRRAAALKILSTHEASVDIVRREGDGAEFLEIEIERL